MVRFANLVFFLCPSDRNHKIQLLMITLYSFFCIQHNLFFCIQNIFFFAFDIFFFCIWNILFCIWNILFLFEIFFIWSQRISCIWKQIFVSGSISKLCKIQKRAPAVTSLSQQPNCTHFYYGKTEPRRDWEFSLHFHFSSSAWSRMKRLCTDGIIIITITTIITIITLITTIITTTTNVFLRPTYPKW